MKIQLIGTGNITSTRNSASTLINDHILFDTPNGNLKAMLRQNVDIYKIDTIIISHEHGDHNFDIPFILLYKSKFPQDSLKIITDENTKKTLELLKTGSHFFDFDESEIKQTFIDIKDVNDKKIDDQLKIENESMIHGKVKYATGYIFKDENVTLGLTGDTKLCEGVEKLASKVDYLIADMSREKGTDSHMGINDILELLAKYPKLKIIPTHMMDITRQKAKELNEERLIILEDGAILEV